MSDAVHVNPEDLQRLARAIMSFTGELDDSVRKVFGVLRDIEWDDNLKRRFEDRLTEVTSNVSRVLQDDMDDLTVKLRRAAETAESIRRTQW